jgi:hypothetical protein
MNILKQNSEENKDIKYYCEHIIKNEDVLKSNKKLWDVYKDTLLKQLVIMLNFDFKEISKCFDRLCKIIHKSKEEEYIYNETELRRHWGFLHAMRFLGKEVNQEFYLSLNN